MIDLALLRDNPDIVKRSQEARGESPETVDAAIDADRARRAAITAFEELRAAQNEAHLCCGSAGTYSVLHPELSYPLRDRKLGVLAQAFGKQPPDVILSANIGCITHLQSGTGTPVRHWVEVLDEALATA